MKKIDSKITGYSVKKPGEVPEGVSTPAELEHMHEGIERPELLRGSTYKIKPPNSSDALYVTINDRILNEGTEYEIIRPFEIFINSKNLDQFQWVVALTRVISAVFRKGGDVIFLVEELGAVFDPQGGYFKRGGKFVPSLVAEIGGVIEHHFKAIGLIEVEELSDTVKSVLEEKKKQLGVEGSDYPSHASLCSTCGIKAVVILDGCSTCLECGASKCG